MMFRSTKGASKQRRDLINTEILQLRDLLPLPETARQRLSQLQIMSLACCYIRKNSYFSKLFGNPKMSAETPFEFSQAMSGFLLITNKEGKMLYISENVTEFLGHSMVDMLTQGDSLYDIIDKRDHTAVQSELSNVTVGGPGIDEKTFFCRMNVSRTLRRQGGYGDHKVMYCRGHYAQSMDHYGNQPVFIAAVTPLITPDVKESIIQNNTMIFQSVHGLDMKYMELSNNGEHHLGYSEEECKGKSWYEYIHPTDLNEARDKHAQLIKSSHEMGCMLTVRMMTSTYEWKWVNIVMHIRQPFVCDDSDPTIVCINQIIDDSESSHFKLQSQLYSSHIARSPEFLTASQQSSPPHTITHVPMETDPYSGVAFTASSPAYYQSEYVVTTTQNQPGVTMATLSSSSSMSDSSSDSQGEDWRAKEELHNKLKRKMAATQQCKPKKVRYSSDSMPGSKNLSEGIPLYSAITTLSNMQGGLELQAVRAGDGAVMMQDSPVYAQLNNSIDLKVKNPDVMLMAVNPHSPGPLTPDSMVSDGGMSHHTSLSNTSLTIDVTDAALVPPSMLTPDASPMNSPVHLNHGSPEQCVPSVIEELEEALRKDDITMMQPKRKEKQIKMKTRTNLPELDALCIDSYFGTLESLSKSLCMPLKEATTPQPVIIKQEALEELEFGEDMQVLLSDGHIANLMSSVADTILNMVQLPNQPAVLVDDLCDVKDEESGTALMQEGVSMSHEHIMHELHQLNQLAATSSPSYGEDEFATALFEQNL